ncbi:MAG TPA: type II restriction endonuclease [Lacunisphaera sp.]
MLASSTLASLLARYKADPESVYHTWFVGDADRLKAFRSIRRGVKECVDRIADGTFGNDFKGSPLEVVLTAITEQKQVFAGAAHPFYWKPKLRIPDIYEHADNQRKFGAFLVGCLDATTEDRVLAEMSRLAEARIKGLGPAVASIVYFLHPTIVPPFNTAIVNGFNALFSDRKKLGSWTSYLEMRETIVRTNDLVRGELSKDLGALAGLLFEIGVGRLVVAGNADTVLHQENERARQAAQARHREVAADQQEESEHTRLQHLLIKLGRALAYEVHVARNDRHRCCGGEAFALLTVGSLPEWDWPPEVLDTVSLIDVLWLDPSTREVVCAFEVEKSTSIYSGILRLEDLARSMPRSGAHFYLVAPESREREVLAQLARPAFCAGLAGIPLAYLPSAELTAHGDALGRFGGDCTVLRKLARGRPLAPLNS